MEVHHLSSTYPQRVRDSRSQGSEEPSKSWSEPPRGPPPVSTHRSQPWSLASPLTVMRKHSQAQRLGVLMST